MNDHVRIPSDSGPFAVSIHAPENVNGDWSIQAIDTSQEGVCEVTVFGGAGADGRAREYALWKYGRRL